MEQRDSLNWEFRGGSWRKTSAAARRVASRSLSPGPLSRSNQAAPTKLHRVSASGSTSLYGKNSSAHGATSPSTVPTTSSTTTETRGEYSPYKAKKQSLRSTASYSTPETAPLFSSPSDDAFLSDPDSSSSPQQYQFQQQPQRRDSPPTVSTVVPPTPPNNEQQSKRSSQNDQVSVAACSILSDDTEPVVNPIPSQHIRCILAAFGNTKRSTNNSKKKTKKKKKNERLDLYRDVLQVEANATDRQLRNAYFRRGREVLGEVLGRHQEKSNKEQVAAGTEAEHGAAAAALLVQSAAVALEELSFEEKQRFKAISMAYDIVSNPVWRQVYDACGRDLWRVLRLPQPPPTTVVTKTSAGRASSSKKATSSAAESKTAADPTTSTARTTTPSPKTIRSVGYRAVSKLPQPQQQPGGRATVLPTTPATPVYAKPIVHLQPDHQTNTTSSTSDDDDNDIPKIRIRHVDPRDVDGDLETNNKTKDTASEHQNQKSSAPSSGTAAAQARPRTTGIRWNEQVEELVYEQDPAEVEFKLSGSAAAVDDDDDDGHRDATAALLESIQADEEAYYGTSASSNNEQQAQGKKKKKRAAVVVGAAMELGKHLEQLDRKFMSGLDGLELRLEEMISFATSSSDAGEEEVVVVVTPPAMSSSSSSSSSSSCEPNSDESSPPQSEESDTSPPSESDTSPQSESDTSPQSESDTSPQSESDTSPQSESDTSPQSESDTSPPQSEESDTSSPLSVEDGGARQLRPRSACYQETPKTSWSCSSSMYTAVTPTKDNKTSSWTSGKNAGNRNSSNVVLLASKPATNNANEPSSSSSDEDHQLVDSSVVRDLFSRAGLQQQLQQDPNDSLDYTISSSVLTGLFSRSGAAAAATARRQVGDADDDDLDTAAATKNPPDKDDDEPDSNSDKVEVAARDLFALLTKPAPTKYRKRLAAAKIPLEALSEEDAATTDAVVARPIQVKVQQQQQRQEAEHVELPDDEASVDRLKAAFEPDPFADLGGTCGDNNSQFGNNKSIDRLKAAFEPDPFADLGGTCRDNNNQFGNKDEALPSEFDPSSAFVTGISRNNNAGVRKEKIKSTTTASPPPSPGNRVAAASETTTTRGARREEQHGSFESDSLLALLDPSSREAMAMSKGSVRTSNSPNRGLSFPPKSPDRSPKRTSSPASNSPAAARRSRAAARASVAEKLLKDDSIDELFEEEEILQGPPRIQHVEEPPRLQIMEEPPRLHIGGSSSTPTVAVTVSSASETPSIPPPKATSTATSTAVIESPSKKNSRSSQETKLSETPPTPDRAAAIKCDQDFLSHLSVFVSSVTADLEKLSTRVSNQVKINVEQGKEAGMSILSALAITDDKVDGMLGAMKHKEETKTPQEQQQYCEISHTHTF